jgi:hypothetical protein
MHFIFIVVYFIFKLSRLITNNQNLMLEYEKFIMESRQYG